MDNQEIDKLLEQLNKEIEGIQPDDEKGQALLRELSEDIRELLERAESEAARAFHDGPPGGIHRAF